MERLAVSFGIVYGVVVYDIELWLGVHNAFPYVGIIVVGCFCTINDRSTLYGNKTTVGFYLVVCLYGTYRHVEMNADFVAILHAREVYVTVVAFYGFCVAVVYFYAVGWCDAVVVFIQVAWDNLVFHPSWDAHLEVEVLACFVLYYLYEVILQYPSKLNWTCIPLLYFQLNHLNMLYFFKQYNIVLILIVSVIISDNTFISIINMTDFRLG